MNPPLMPIFLLLTGFSFSGCLQVAPEPAPPPATISSFGPLGGFTMTTGTNCAGHTTLSGATATVNAPCFTGADNVVLCTDTTTAAAVKCAPGVGALRVVGSDGDTIAYARVR